MKEFSKIIEDMIIMEKIHANNLTNSVETINNVVIRGILSSIALDSEKHAGLFAAILELLKGENRAIFEEDYDKLSSVINQHIEVEKKMTEQLGNLMQENLNHSIKHLLREIEKDEIKHHSVLKGILDTIIKKESISENEYWDIIWKDVPGHTSLVME